MNSNPLLAYEWVTGASESSNTQTAVMLHGILGQRRNLFGFARRFVKAFPRWRVLLVDLRNHGQSLGFSGPHSLEACALDLKLLFEALKVTPSSIIGHSFGAGVALAFAHSSDQPIATLESIWLLDAVPALREGVQKSLDPIIDQVLKALDACLPTQSKALFTQNLRERGLSKGLVDWLSMNLSEHQGSLSFSPNPALAREMLADYAKNFALPQLDLEAARRRVFIVKAENNPQWRDLQTRAHILLLPKSGHWVHVDNPEGLLELMAGDFA